MPNSNMTLRFSRISNTNYPILLPLCCKNVNTIWSC